MRKLAFILFTITTVFALTSCGSDDEKEQIFFEGECKQTVEIKGYSGQVAETNPAVTSTLSDMLKDNPNYGSPISTGEFYPDRTSIKIVGLKEGVTLAGFTLTINGKSQVFGDIKLPNGSTEYILYTGSYTDFFKNGFNMMVNKKQLETVVKFTPSVDVTAADNVKLEIVYRGKFSYWAKK